MLETYLRCIEMHNLSRWYDWLSQAQWWFNFSYYSAIKITSFQTLFGYPPSAREMDP